MTDCVFCKCENITPGAHNCLTLQQENDVKIRDFAIMYRDVNECNMIEYGAKGFYNVWCMFRNVIAQLCWIMSKIKEYKPGKNVTFTNNSDGSVSINTEIPNIEPLIEMFKRINGSVISSSKTIWKGVTTDASTLYILSEPLSNFKYVEIFYNSGSAFDSVRFPTDQVRFGIPSLNTSDTVDNPNGLLFIKEDHLVVDSPTKLSWGMIHSALIDVPYKGTLTGVFKGRNLELANINGGDLPINVYRIDGIKEETIKLDL